MSTKITLFERILPCDEPGYQNRCTAARIANKRQSYFLFLRVVHSFLNAQPATVAARYTQQEIETCAALLQEHYAQLVIQLDKFRRTKLF